MTSTEQGYGQWRNKRDEVMLGFGSQVPAVTRRSEGGLRDQVGVVFGLQASGTLFDGLMSNAQRLLSKESDPWRLYASAAIHCSLASIVAQDQAHTQQIWHARSQLAELEATFLTSPIVLSSPEVRVNGDTLIVSLTPTPEFFALQRSLAAYALWDQLGLKSGWGAHLTLGRARRALTASEAAETTNWITNSKEWFGATLTLDIAVARAFTVENEIFYWA